MKNNSKNFIYEQSHWATNNGLSDWKRLRNKNYKRIYVEDNQYDELIVFYI